MLKSLMTGRRYLLYFWCCCCGASSGSERGIQRSSFEPNIQLLKPIRRLSLNYHPNQRNPLLEKIEMSIAREPIQKVVKIVESFLNFWNCGKQRREDKDVLALSKSLENASGSDHGRSSTKADYSWGHPVEVIPPAKMRKLHNKVSTNRRVHKIGEATNVSLQLCSKNLAKGKVSAPHLIPVENKRNPVIDSETILTFSMAILDSFKYFYLFV